MIERGARADLERIKAEDPPPRHKVLEYYEWEARRADAADSVVMLDAARWLGLDRGEASRSMAISRAYRDGERAGRWHRLVERGRTVGLLLLPAEGGKADG